MSKCMTIADETVDQKETCAEILPKDIVHFILEEALLSAFISSDKDCSRIGDFNIAEDFRQQYDQLPHLKDFEQVNHNKNDSAENQEPNHKSGENVERSGTRENLSLIIDSYVKVEEKLKPAGECTIITEDILANNELQIENGQIHLGKGNEDVAEGTENDGKVEIEYYAGGQLNKIFVPLNPEGVQSVAGFEANPTLKVTAENPERPFEPITTEELRQVWENGNSSLVGNWDGDVLTQREEAVRLMEELYSVHVFPDNSVDPNRPRACAFDEEDVKKMTKEIEEINFNPCHASPEDLDRQGDAELTTSISKPQNLPPKDSDPLNLVEDQKSIASNATVNLEYSFNQFNGNNPNKDYPISNKNPPDVAADQQKTGASFTIIRNDTESESSLNAKISTGFSNGHGTCGEFYPMSTSKSLKFDESTLNNLERSSELGSRGKDSNGETHNDSAPLEASSVQQGTNSSTDTFERLNPDLNSQEERPQLLSTDANLIPEITKSQDAANLLQECQISYKNSQYDRHNNEYNENMECDFNKNEEYTENCQEPRTAGSETMNVDNVNINPLLARNSTASRGSNKMANGAEEPSDSCGNQETPTASQASSQSKVPDEKEKGEDETSEAPPNQTFKLYSEKMYWGPNHEMTDRLANEYRLTESEEGLIDMTESVIQVIEPSENSIEDSGSKLTFSLLSESPSNRKNPSSSESEAEFPVEETEDRDYSDTNLPKRVYSGMTTIGPIKNADRDPKDLTAPEIDFGRMTRITSSRQLGKDIGLFSSEVTAIRIVEEDDFDDEEDSTATEEDRPDRTSLVNRDIASLTKVQKIREVMSYHPKSDEDFEDKEVLPRSRLDLKDVESLTDERYKVADVPLLSFEITEGNLTGEKELIENINLVISGIADTVFYDEEDYSAEENPQEDQGNAEAAVTESGGSAMEKKSEERGEEVPETLSGTFSGAESRTKFSTLGTVFRKASTKIIKKEGDEFIRNSKSLPRETSRISTTDSIRSMLDECHSSATSMLKKSRSLLRNTQGIFKSISQGRVNGDSVKAEQKKLSPSESDVTSVERKFSNFLKKEDFMKAKNLIKDKVEKTFRPSKTDSTHDEKELRVVVKNKGNLQVDRMENFKKFLPRSPLVYKSQFVKSQMNVQSNTAIVATDSEQQDKVGEPLTVIAAENGGEKIPNAERGIDKATDLEQEISCEEKLHWITGTEEEEEEDAQISTQEDPETQQPDYIVMETVEGLPGSDLESPSSQKENFYFENKVETVKERKPPISPEKLPEDGHDGVEDKPLKKPSPKTKKKNFTARFRSFWCSAFGRVKTPRGKGGPA